MSNLRIPVFTEMTKEGFLSTFYEPLNWEQGELVQILRMIPHKSSRLCKKGLTRDFALE